MVVVVVRVTCWAISEERLPENKDTFISSACVERSAFSLGHRGSRDSLGSFGYSANYLGTINMIERWCGDPGRGSESEHAPPHPGDMMGPVLGLTNSYEFQIAGKRG